MAAATAAKLDAQRGRRPTEAGGPTVRAAIDSFLDSPDTRANPNTLRAYTSVLDRVGEKVGSRRPPKRYRVPDGEADPHSYRE